MRNQVTSNPKILETLLNLYLFEAVSFLSRFNIWNPLLRIGWASAKKTSVMNPLHITKMFIYQ